jgi:hypothetical protein
VRRDLLVPRLATAAVIVVVIVVLLLAGSSGGGGGVVISGTATAPPPPAESSAEQFGVNVNRLFNDGTYTPQQIDAQLSELQRTGATLARSDALWEATEPAPPVAGKHRYDWSFDDRIAGSLAAHGLQWLPIVDYSAPWAQSIAGSDHSPPRSTADYAAYAGALAARYGPGGSFWRAHPSLTARPVATYEIWNEPDSPVFWAPTPDASRYAQLYLAARGAIAAVDPSAQVIIGGLTRPESFMPALLAADPGMRGRIDGVAIHPYGPTPDAVLASVAAARRALSSLGLATVPLYVTEFGWTTRPSGAIHWAPEAMRPGYIERTLAGLGPGDDCNVAATLLYTWVTPERTPTDEEDWFGISPPAGGSSPDVTAFARGLQEARAGGEAGVCG